MYPTLFRIRDFEITSFGAMVACAALVGLPVFGRVNPHIVGPFTLAQLIHVAGRRGRHARRLRRDRVPSNGEFGCRPAGKRAVEDYELEKVFGAHRGWREP